MISLVASFALLSTHLNIECGLILYHFYQRRSGTGKMGWDGLVGWLQEGGHINAWIMALSAE
jgi:hypothetical protein